MKFLHRNKKGVNTNVFIESDYVVLNYEQLLIVNGAGAPSGGGGAQGPSTTEHYDRNDNQSNLPKTVAEIEKAVEKGEYIQVPAEESIYHKQGTASDYNPKNNVKYVSADGRNEIVFNEKGEVVTDNVNKGTYNYANQITDKAEHAVKDVLPYIIYGNSSDDPTYWYERIGGTYKEDVNYTKDERKEMEYDKIMEMYNKNHM